MYNDFVKRIPHEQRRNKGEGTDDEDLDQQPHRAKLSSEVTMSHQKGEFTMTSNHSTKQQCADTS